MKFLLVFLAIFYTNQHKLIENNNPKSNKIKVHINDIEKGKGKVYVGLFDHQDSFTKINEVFLYKVVDANQKEMEVELENVPFDDYALVIFQDFNENAKFDKNFLGLPKEPFGFSTNFKVLNRAPTYNDVKFMHNSKITRLQVNLQKF